MCAVAVLQVGYFHAFVDGVDYVFVDHPAFFKLGKNIYGGERGEIMFRCALLCKVRCTTRTSRATRSRASVRVSS